MPTSVLCQRCLWFGRRREFPGRCLAVGEWEALTHLDSLTYYNVAISVVSLFFLLAKLIGFIMNVWYPIFGLGVNIGIAAVYSVSVYGQIGPDYADPRYPAPAAWYFRFGCGLAKRYGKYSDCQIAQASLGITLYML